MATQTITVKYIDDSRCDPSCPHLHNNDFCKACQYLLHTVPSFVGAVESITRAFPCRTMFKGKESGEVMQVIMNFCIDGHYCGKDCGFLSITKCMCKMNGESLKSEFAYGEDRQIRTRLCEDLTLVQLQNKFSNDTSGEAA